MIKRGSAHKKSETKAYPLLFILIRYIILLGLMFSLSIVYKILTPVTVYPVYLALKTIYSNVQLINNIGDIFNLIVINNETGIEIVPACIAGSAYLLLLILNLAVPMKFKKRIKSIFLSVILLLFLNIIRIFIFSVLYHSSFPFFDFMHKLFWYIISTLFVVGIWFLTVKIYRINEIPVYTDFLAFYTEIKSKTAQKLKK